MYFSNLLTLFDNNVCFKENRWYPVKFDKKYFYKKGYGPVIGKITLKLDKGFKSFKHSC